MAETDRQRGRKPHADRQEGKRGEVQQEEADNTKHGRPEVCGMRGGMVKAEEIPRPQW